MSDDFAAVQAMARAVKHARVALQGSLIACLRADGSAMRAAHAQVFEALDPGGTRLTLLAERTNMSHQAMSELVAELVGHGYLERVADPDDGRAKLIRPTPEGRAELTRAGAHLAEIRTRWQQRLTGLTVDEVVAALAELIAACDELTADRRRPVTGGRPE
jgi:DNA-binding MarR family transcriptional regulator